MSGWDSYNKSRAVKKQQETKSIDTDVLSKRQKRKIKTKIKNSTILLIVAITLVIGVATGFLLQKFTSSFIMNNFYVNGVVSEEKDYVFIDLTQVKEKLENTKALNADDTPVTITDVANSVTLEDNGASLKFFGINKNKAIKTKILYREDISHDVVEVSNINLSVPGVYYIEYSTTHFSYKNVKLIRTVVVTGVEIDG